jgi:hypothetical protein
MADTGDEAGAGAGAGAGADPKPSPPRVVMGRLKNARQYGFGCIVKYGDEVCILTARNIAAALTLDDRFHFLPDGNLGCAIPGVFQVGDVNYECTGWTACPKNAAWALVRMESPPEGDFPIVELKEREIKDEYIMHMHYGDDIRFRTEKVRERDLEPGYDRAYPYAVKRTFGCTPDPYPLTTHIGSPVFDEETGELVGVGIYEPGMRYGMAFLEPVDIQKES